VLKECGGFFGWNPFGKVWGGGVAGKVVQVLVTQT